MNRALGIFLLAVVSLSAQTPSRRIRAFGDASVSVRPDQALLTVSVITQAKTAQEASSQNAAKADAVFKALSTIVGTTGEIKTVGYSVQPNYNYPRDSQRVLVDFTATNSVQVTLNNLDLTGRLIDTAVESGATQVGALQLGLKDDDPVRAQALRAAGQKARTRAEAIAAGLNVRLGAVAHAEEGYVSRILSENRMLGAATPGATTTPVSPGTLEVTATITVEWEILP